MVQGHVEWVKFFWALLAQLVLLLVIRVMDDVKDYEKDKIVHPDRYAHSGDRTLMERIAVAGGTTIELQNVLVRGPSSGAVQKQQS